MGIMTVSLLYVSSYGAVFRDRDVSLPGPGVPGGDVRPPHIELLSPRPWPRVCAEQLRQPSVRPSDDDEGDEDVLENVEDEVVDEDEVKADLDRLLQDVENEKYEDWNAKKELVGGKEYAGLGKSTNISLISSKLSWGPSIFASINKLKTEIISNTVTFLDLIKLFADMRRSICVRKMSRLNPSVM